MNTVDNNTAPIYDRSGFAFLGSKVLALVIEIADKKFN